MKLCHMPHVRIKAAMPENKALLKAHSGLYAVGPKVVEEELRGARQTPTKAGERAHRGCHGNANEFAVWRERAEAGCVGTILG